MKSDKEILAELRSATAGLLVMSESDYPFELIQWSGDIAITPAYLCNISQRPPGCEIEEIQVEAFLGMDERFRKVQAVLQANLTDLKGYKVGTINIPVYLVGLSAEGNWLGVSTRLIQT